MPRRVVLSCLLGAGVWLGGGQSTSQAQPFAPEFEPTTKKQTLQQDPSGRAAETPGGHESEDETIAKCLRDLAEGNVRARRRAVMILGKYRDPLAMRGVIASMRDADAEVRRSALVSASEWPMLPPGAVDEILRLIRDEDVHIRRLASSMLPDLVRGRGMRLSSGNGNVRILRPPVGASTQGADQKLFSRILNLGLKDADVTVRRNLLAVAPYVPELLQRPALEVCLQDEDEEVRVLAVRAYARLNGEEPARAAALAALINDPATIVRREAARALGRLGREGFGPLKAFLEDEDAGVRLAVVRELVQLRHPDGLKSLREVVFDESLPASERRDLLRYARGYRDAAADLLKELTESRSSMLRTEALGSLARLSDYEWNADFFRGFLDDESMEVRRAAARALTQMAARARSATQQNRGLDSKRLTKLLSSPYSDVRELAVQLALYLPAAARHDLLLEACLDDDVAVRCQALRRLAMLGTRAAREIVVRSLQDPNDEVVVAAIQGLSSRPDAQALEALTAFYKRCENEVVKKVAAAGIARLQRALTQGHKAAPSPPAAQRPGQALPAPRRWPVPRESSDDPRQTPTPGN